MFDMKSPSKYINPISWDYYCKRQRLPHDVIKTRFLIVSNLKLIKKQRVRVVENNPKWNDAWNEKLIMLSRNFSGKCIQ